MSRSTAGAAIVVVAAAALALVVARPTAATPGDDGPGAAPTTVDAPLSFAEPGTIAVATASPEPATGDTPALGLAGVLGLLLGSASVATVATARRRRRGPAAPPQADRATDRA